MLLITYLLHFDFFILSGKSITGFIACKSLFKFYKYYIYSYMPRGVYTTILFKNERDTRGFYI